MRLLIVLIFATVLIAGCSGSGGGSGTSTTTGSVSGALSTDNGSGNVTVDPGNETNTTNIVHRTHNPEPSTIILFGIGLAGIARLALRKKKKA